MSGPKGGHHSPRLLGLALPGILFFLGMQALLTATVWFKGFGQFSGPDPYMRLARVLECRGACQGGLVTHSNTPYGEILHWPYLLDRMILVIAAPLRAFLDFRASVVVAGYLVGPILGVAAMLALTAVARTILDDRAARWVPFLASVHFWVLYSFAPVRPDHHGLQVLLFLLVLLGELRLLLEADARTAPWMTGIAVGLAVWVSTEGLISVAPLIGALVVIWIARGGTDLTRSLAVIAMVAAAVIALGLLVDGPQPDRWAVEFDRLSVVHLTAFMLGVAFWLGLAVRVPAQAVTRAATATVGAVAAVLILVALFPGVQRGPMANIDPALVPLWLDRVSEFEPASQLGTSTWGILAMGPGVVGLVVAAYLVAGAGRPGWNGILQGGRRAGPGFAVISGALLWFLVLSEVEQVRWTHYVQILAPLGLAALLVHIIRLARGMRAPRPVRGAAVVGTAMVFFLWPLAVLGFGGEDGTQDPSRVACRPGPTVEALEGLRGPGGRRARVLASAFWGPELLFRANVDIVVGPYHRNARGMLDSYRVMSATDPATAMALLKERGIDYVVLCAIQDWIPVVPVDSTGTLYRALVEGTPPGGLRSVPLPGVPERFRLYQVEDPPGAPDPGASVPGGSRLDVLATPPRPSAPAPAPP